MKKKHNNLKKYLNKGVSTTSGILIVLLAAAVAGILIWQFWPEQESGFGPEVDVGVIEGSLAYPSDFIPPDMRICAKNTQTGEEYCTEEHIKDEKYTYGEGYKIEVAPGDYFVYANLSSWGDYNAYYSEFVTCGMKVECPSHEPILVSAEKGDIVIGIDPMDWYVIPEQEQEDETADWKTYRNETFGFEIRHPENWRLLQEADIISFQPPFSDLYFNIDKISSQSTVKEFLEGIDSDAIILIEQKNIQVDGRTAIQRNTSYSRAPEGEDSWTTYIEDSIEQGYSITIIRLVGRPEVINETIVSLYNQILSTFKFID